MLEFLMNPPITQILGSSYSELNPWIITILALIKMLLIAVGSLLITSVIIGSVIILAQTIKWLLLLREICFRVSRDAIAESDIKPTLHKLAA